MSFTNFLISTRNMGVSCSKIKFMPTLSTRLVLQASASSFHASNTCSSYHNRLNSEGTVVNGYRTFSSTNQNVDYFNTRSNQSHANLTPLTTKTNDVNRNLRHVNAANGIILTSNRSITRLLSSPILYELQQFNQYHTPSTGNMGIKEGTTTDTKTDTQSDIKSDTKSESVSMEPDSKALTMRAKLKRAVRDYGATIVVFHVTLALTNFGLTYLAVSSGLDLPFYLIKMGFSEEMVQTKIMTGASNGLVAYAVYKVFAPVRIVITLSVAPILVRYLRAKGILKMPKVKV